MIPLMLYIGDDLFYYEAYKFIHHDESLDTTRANTEAYDEKTNLKSEMEVKPNTFLHKNNVSMKIMCKTSKRQRIIGSFKACEHTNKVKKVPKFLSIQTVNFFYLSVFLSAGIF